MYLEILGSTVSLSGDLATTSAFSLSLKVVPESGVIYIGERDLFSQTFTSLRNKKGARPVEGRVNFVTDVKLFENFLGNAGQDRDAGDAVGIVHLTGNPEDEIGVDEDWPTLSLDFYIVVSPDTLDLLLRQNIQEPGSGTLYLGIEDLTFGTLPNDYKWPIDDPSNFAERVRLIRSFRFDLKKFATTEKAIMLARDIRNAEEQAESRDQTTRKLAQKHLAELRAEEPDQTTILIGQCRNLLIGLGLLLVLILINLRA